MNTIAEAVNQSTANTNKQQKLTAKEVIAANVQALIEQLGQGHSEALTAYLTAMGRFHNYSFGNILEIARQKPDATLRLTHRTTPSARVARGVAGKVRLSLRTARVIPHMTDTTSSTKPSWSREWFSPLGSTFAIASFSSHTLMRLPLARLACPGLNPRPDLRHHSCASLWTTMPVCRLSLVSAKDSRLHRHI